MKKGKWILFALVLFLIYKVYAILELSGVFLKIVEINTKNEEIIQSPAGIEDITIDQETGLAYLSSQDRRTLNAVGAIYLVNTKDSNVVFKDLTSKFKITGFRPHGISFVKTPQNEKFLFVISHGNSKSEIINFKVEGDSLIFLNKYSSTEIISPNDILALSKNQFFITNDHTRKKDWLRSIGDYLKFPSGNVVYFDGEKARIVSNGIAYANGINLSPNGQQIYVTSTTTNKLYIFEPNIQSKQLEEIANFNLLFSPDNIEIKKDGNLLIACHPKVLDFTKHALNPKKHSASAILELKIDLNKNSLNQKTIYLNNGESISGSSVGAPFSENKLLVGSVFEKKILRLTY